MLQVWSSRCSGRDYSHELIRHQKATAEKLGLNLTDLKALASLHRRADMTPKHIAEVMGMSAAATTTIIDRLEEAGYVERKRGDGDRRSVSVPAMEGSEKKGGAPLQISARSRRNVGRLA
jgi:DNA-binding MarR family transcriptional regulator